MPQNNIQNGVNSFAQEEVTEIIGNPPGCLLQSGITMIGIVVFCILSLSSFIEYPDIISVQARLTSNSPPIELVSKSDGYINELLVSDRSEVEVGQDLIIIRNTANQNEITLLEKWIQNYEKIKIPSQYLNHDLSPNYQLGVIQNDYAQLILKYNELRQNLKNGMVFKQMNAISEEVNKIKKLNSSLHSERNIFKEELDLQNKDFLRNLSLHNDGVISELTLEQAQTLLLQKRRQYESMEKETIQNKIRIEQLELEKLRLQGDRAELITSCQFIIAEIITRIKTSIKNWSTSYIIKAPISGEISLKNDITENLFVKNNEPIAYIIPTNSNQKYLTIQSPISHIGKIKTGQKTIIKFDAYPYKEFGIVESYISNIARIPHESDGNLAVYEIRSNLPDTIITDFNNTIPYLPNMTATTEIVTESRTVTQRIFNQFLSLLKHK